jgi:hypothetical protein
MPNTTIAAPALADSVDRLTLGVTDARTESSSPAVQAICMPACSCMAEE